MKILKTIKTHLYISFLLAAVIAIIVTWIVQLFAGPSCGTWTKHKHDLLPIHAHASPTEKFRRDDKQNVVSKDVQKQGGDSKGEIECRRVLQKIYGRPFNKDRPDFLNNPVTGGIYNLELDCYDKDLKIAVEYSGRQHYEYVPFFHKNKEAFLNQKYRDDMKRRMCVDNGVFLIEIPYTTKIADIEAEIIIKLTQTQ